MSDTQEIQSDNIENPQSIPDGQTFIDGERKEELIQIVETNPQPEKPKHAGGRPTDYSKEKLKKTRAYIEECANGVKDLEGTVVKPPRMPFIEELALILDIDDDTIVEWAKAKDKPEFSAAIKKIKMLQRLRLQQRVLGKNQPTGAIFLLKANHNFVDRVDITSEGKAMPTPIAGGLATAQNDVHTNNSNTKTS